jgi:hypothetical protein
VLPRDGWLTFDLPPRTKVIRLISNADFPRARRGEFPAPLPDTVKWPYAFQCQLLDGRGRVLLERDYHQQTQLTEYADPVTATTVLSVFYLGEEVQPADSRVVFLNLAEAGGPVAQVRLRLLETPEPLTGVAVRVYYPMELPPHRVRYGWQRLDEDRRQKLARSNVYRPELLTEQEQHNLFEHIWKPIAPAGARGGDYQARDLYALKDIPSAEVREPPPPAGSLVDEGRHAVLPIPEQGGNVRFVFEPVDARQTGDQVELTWYGKGPTQRAVYRVPWAGRATTFQQALAGGLVEVKATFPLAVRAYLLEGRAPDRRHAPGDAEITPDVINAWSYLLDGTTPLEFDVLHAGAEPTPLRVDLRQYTAVRPDRPTSGLPAQAPTPVRVHYALLDGAGRPVREGDLPLDQPPSVYDRLTLNRVEYLVTEPASAYVSAPPGAARLVFPPAKVPVLVTLYDRPGDLVKLSRVPEDYFRFNRDEVAQRSWFPVRAARHDALELEGRAPLLELQSRPQPDVPDLTAGVYEWDHFLPEGSWRARGLLVPRDPAAPFRTEELPATFQEVVPGRETPLEFLAQPGRDELSLSLLYLGEGPGPLTLRLFVDGRLHDEERVPGPRGEVLLPRLDLAKGGRHRVCVTTSAPVRVFLNYVNPGKSPGFVKRLAVALDRGGLAFDYDKVSPDDETLCVRLFRPPGVTDRTVVRLRLELASDALGPYTSWTLRDRRYDLAPADGDPVPVLGTPGENVDPGQDFFFPLGNDLPPGKYRVRLDIEEGPGGYVCLSRITPGAYERRDFFIEQPFRTDAPRRP